MSESITIRNYEVRHVTKDTIEESLEDCEETMARVREELLVLAATTPRDVRSDYDGELVDWHWHLPMKIRELLEEYGDAAAKASALNQAMAWPEDVR